MVQVLNLNIISSPAKILLITFHRMPSEEYNKLSILTFSLFIHEFLYILGTPLYDLYFYVIFMSNCNIT